MVDQRIPAQSLLGAHVAHGTQHVARLGEAVVAACAQAAAGSTAALGLRDVTRVDMIVDPNGHPWVLEVNVSPGMTDMSLLPMGAQAQGMSLADLCDRIVRSAIARG